MIPLACKEVEDENYDRNIAAIVRIKAIDNRVALLQHARAILKLYVNIDFYDAFLFASSASLIVLVLVLVLGLWYAVL